MEKAESVRNRGGRPTIYATPEEKRAARRVSQRKWRERNIDVARADGRKREADRRRKNPEKCNEAVQSWRKRNPEKQREIIRRGSRKYMAKKRSENPELSRMLVQQWRSDNADRFRELSRVYKASRRSKQKAGGKFTTEDIRELWKQQQGRCAFCLGKLKPRGYHVDHYVPISRGGSNDRGNLRLLHPLCNLEKSASDPLDHARKNGLLCW